MAPLDPFARARLYIEYTSCGIKHTQVLHLAAGSDESEAAAVFTALTTEMRPLIPSNDAITGARYGAAGSHISFPVVTASVAGTGSAWTDIDKGPNFISLVGRSPDGRRTRFTLFTPAASADAGGYRGNTPSGAIADILAALEELSPPVVTISGATPVWYSYVNLGYNAYWQRQLRKLHAA